MENIEMNALTHFLKKRNLTQVQASKMLGLHQAQISRHTNEEILDAMIAKQIEVLDTMLVNTFPGQRSEELDKCLFNAIFEYRQRVMAMPISREEKALELTHCNNAEQLLLWK